MIVAINYKLTDDENSYQLSAGIADFAKLIQQLFRENLPLSVIWNPINGQLIDDQGSLMVFVPVNSRSINCLSFLTRGYPLIPVFVAMVFIL